MNGALNILNMQAAPAQAQVKSAKQGSDNLVSFLSFLQGAVSAGKSAESAENFSGVNLNKPSENILNESAKTNDINSINNAQINSGEVSVLAKVLNGEAEDLAEAGIVEELVIIEEIKSEVTELIVRDKDGEEESERIDISKVLGILGVPAEIIPEMIAALIEPEIILDNSLDYEDDAADNSAGASVPVSFAEAGRIISEAAELVYTGSAEQVISGQLPEQVQENITDFAGVLDDSGDFKDALINYAAEKLEINNTGLVKLDAESIKEVIRRAVNNEPEVELISAERTGETSAEKRGPDLLELSGMMRRAVNITQVAAQPVISDEMPETGLAQSGAEVSLDTEMQIEASDNIIIDNDINNSEEIVVERIINNNPGAAVQVNNMIADMQVQTQTADAVNVNIESFSSSVAQIIADGTNGVMTSRIIGSAGGSEVFEIRLRLKPEALGEVFLKITYRDGNVGLNIIASNAAAERAILSQMGELRESLEAQEINLASFDINNFNNQNSQNQGRENGRNHGLNNNTGEIRAREEAEAERREVVANYMRSRRIFYKTI